VKSATEKNVLRQLELAVWHFVCLFVCFVIVSFFMNEVGVFTQQMWEVVEEINDSLVCCNVITSSGT